MFKDVFHFRYACNVKEAKYLNYALVYISNDNLV